MSTTKEMKLISGRFEVKSVDEEKRTFEGDLSTSHMDLGDGYARDIVMPGGFKRTLDHFNTSVDPYIPLLDSHDRWSVLSILGHMTAGEEILTGQVLEYEMEGDEVLRIPEMKLRTSWTVIDGNDGDRVLDRLRPGSARNMSMGYRTVEWRMMTLATGEPLRLLDEVMLREGSLVVFGMNPEAQVDIGTVKALMDLKEVKEEDRQTLIDLQARLNALLKPGSEKEPPEGPAKTANVEELLSKIGQLRADRLSTRIRRLGGHPEITQL